MNKTLCIGCKGLQRYVSIGVNEEERRLKCLLEFNCSAILQSGTNEYSGYPTLDYMEIVKHIDEAAKLNFILLEELGHHILNQIGMHHKGIQFIELEIIKRNPLWSYGSGSVFVKMERDFTSSST